MKWFTVVIAAVILAAPEIEISVLRDRLDTYLIKYEPALSAVVAKEHMTQRDGAGPNAIRQTAYSTRNRELISEVAFVGLPGNAGWLGFRRVIEMNGKTVKDAGPPLSQLLTDGAKDDFDQARVLLTQSAERNLGLPRTTNLPNLPLEFLHPRNKHRFANRLDGHERVNGTDTVRLELREQSSPTLIQRPEGGDMNSLVTAWIEPESGRLLRAQVKTRDARIGYKAFDAIIWVEFRHDANVGILVPWEMREEFFAGNFREGTGKAKYSDYRRFQTAARILPPQ